MNPFCINLLGGFSAEINNTPITKFRTAKARALLAWLAVRPDQEHPRTTLATLLWGDTTDKAAKTNLRIELSGLKKSLQAHPALQISRTTVRFDSALATVDVLALRAGVDADDVATVEQAVAHYRGDFLAGLYFGDAPDFEDWKLLTQERLHQQVMGAFDWLREQYATQAQWGQLNNVATRQLGLIAWHEPAHRSLLKALVKQGQQQAAREQYARCRTILQEELGVEPSLETQQLWQRLLRRQTATIQTNLPRTLTPFFGRKYALTHFRQAFADRTYRLHTLTGLGGSGKTRLALEIARQSINDFADGVWFVPLAQVTTVDGIIPAIGDALNVQFASGQALAGQLHNHLHDQEALLVLDNLEQLPVESADLIHALIQATEHLVILATSRRRLQLRSEAIFPVDGLTFPEADTAASATDVVYSAVTFFNEQIKRNNPHARPQPALVAEICRLLNGLPLGLELAAGQTDTLTLAEVADSLRSTLDTMRTQMRDVPARQRSLRAVFESSWVLLSPAEQNVLAQLSVFNGGFVNASAHAIISGYSTAIIAELKRHSLVNQDEKGRFGLHQLVKEFSAEKQPSTIARQHSQHYLTLAQQLSPRWLALEFADVQDIASTEWGNFNAAWQHAVTTADTALLAVGANAVRALYRFRVLYHEGAKIFTNPALDICDPAALGRVKAAEAYFAVKLRQHEQVAAAVKIALDCADQLDDYALRNDALLIRQEMLTQQNKLDESLSLGTQIVATAPPHQAAHAQLDMAYTFLVKGDFPAARKLLETAERTYRTQGDVHGLISTLGMLGRAKMFMGEGESAENYLQTALELAQQRQDREREYLIIGELGTLYYHQGDFGQSVEIYKKQLAWRRLVGLPADILNTLFNLGLSYISLGLYVEGASYFEEALEDLKQAESRANLAVCLTIMGSLRHGQDYYQEAIRFNQESLVICREEGINYVEANALAAIGRIHLNANAFEKAATALDAAFVIREQNNYANVAIEAQAGLAHALAGSGKLEAASDHLPHLLENYSLAVRPHRVLYHCAAVLKTLNDERAEWAINKARAALQERADRISDPDHRDSFLHNVPEHRAIINF